jgi:hypothetical protein
MGASLLSMEPVQGRRNPFWDGLLLLRLEPKAGIFFSEKKLFML